MNDLRDKLDSMPNRVLFLNLALTQGVLFVVGLILYYVFLRKKMTITELYHFNDFGTAMLYGTVFAVVIITLDVWLMKRLPKGYFDDGGINERIFRDVNVFQIAVIALFVAFVEEWLFRGVLQNLIGLFWTSILFALLHYRYLNKWFYGMLVLAISFGFGTLYQWTGNLWSVIWAHFLIDFILGCLIRYRLVETRV
ncbi:CPBP family intramembrane glutamic endopeptidase [Caldalkalibacillus salinus]|uniref:CPBP family intramembrane glutamic endopeptidase n=1 Tax=Caldalkalibacillus salinus TaxID=2803787 RepID=UPI001921FF06|nr:CPBP family intramembrane glutamic endopeptidase [Caldalkalibacillus salinus]